MAFNLFGLTLLTPKDVQRQSKPSLVPPRNEGTATIYEGGLGVFGGYAVDFDTYSAYTNEIDLINQYRDLSLQPEVDEAVTSIINEMIVPEPGTVPVSINTDKLPDVYDDQFREQVINEFRFVLAMLDFNNRCYEIARQFYVDGRLFYDMVIDENKPREGVLELRNIDPRTIRPVREVRDAMHQKTGVRISEIVDEYYLYNPTGFRHMTNIAAGGGVRVAKDRIAFVNSGIFTPGNVTVLSALHKAIKPYNQLRMVEDATVIYRITRAPERRVFYIDVADIPTNKAEQYLQSIATRYRNRVVYDSNTGEVRDDRKIQSMLEDFFLPRRSNGRGTEIQTLPGGQNLGEMEDVEYFKRKLYRALGVPVSRLESSGSQFQLGKTTEITRDEIQFSRFLERFRQRFALLFDEVLSRHLTLKGIIRNPSQWRELRQYIRYDFNTDSYFAELKRTEVWDSRVELLSKMQDFVGTYFSEQYIRDHILNLSSEEQARIKLDLAGGEAEDDGDAGMSGGAGEPVAPPAAPANG